MDYYFVTATSEVGPIHFATFTDCHNRERNTLQKVVDIEAKNRHVVFCHDWIAEPIAKFEFDRIAGFRS